MLSYAALVESDAIRRTNLISNLRTITVFASLPASGMSNISRFDWKGDHWIAAALILSIPSIEFWIGEYCLDAFTYPAWCSLVLQLFSLLVNIIFLRHVEDESTNQGIQPDVEEGKGLLFWSPGVLLLMVLFFFDGLLLSSIVYALPIVMIDGYGWSILQYAPVWLGISIMGIAGVQVAKYFGKWLKSYYFALVAPSLVHSGHGLYSWDGVHACFRRISFPCVGGDKLPGLSATADGPFIPFHPDCSRWVYCKLLAPDCFGHESVFLTLKQVRMMPLTSAVGSIGKIIGPFLSEILAQIAGMQLVFLSLFVLSAILFMITLQLHRHLWSVEDDFAFIAMEVSSPFALESDEDFLKAPVPWDALSLHDFSNPKL
jgi:hypothetical protein